MGTRTPTPHPSIPRSQDLSASTRNHLSNALTWGRRCWIAFVLAAALARVWPSEAGATCNLYEGVLIPYNAPQGATTRPYAAPSQTVEIRTRAGNWKGLGKPAGSKGYKYKDAKLTARPVQDRPVQAWEDLQGEGNLGGTGAHRLAAAGPTSLSARTCTHTRSYFSICAAGLILLASAMASAPGGGTLASRFVERQRVRSGGRVLHGILRPWWVR